MRIKQTIKSLIFGAAILLSAFAALTPLTASAEDCVPTATTKCCGNVGTSIVSCTQKGGDNAGIKDAGVWGILLLAINILTAGVGVVAVAGVVYASILYTTSAGEADKTKKAMTMIADIVIGIVAYALLYAVLNFLVPGGLFTAP